MSMRSRQSFTGRVGSGMRVLATQLHRSVLRNASAGTALATAPLPPLPVVAPVDRETPLEFHRRMAAIIMAVQAGIWDKGVHQLLGYATDFGLGQERGAQTLVLKTRGRSAYVRLQWDTVMSDAEEDRLQVEVAIRAAISELA